MKSDKFKVMSSSEVEGGVAICEVYGKKTEVEKAMVVSGGSGTNTAVSFARKELKTACICEVGEDLAGELVLRELERERVDGGYVVREKGEETAVAAILVAGEGERSVMVHRGASAMLEMRDFPWEMKTRWLHVGSLGGNMKLLKRIFKWAKKEGVRVSFNPGRGEIKEREKVLKLLSMVEVLFVNRGEATKLFGLSFEREDVWRNEHCPIGPRVTVITNGKNGGKMCVEGECVFWTGSKVKVVDTTGAGDAFASGFVSAVLYGLSYKQAIEWGRRNAASVVQYMGAKRGLLTLAEIKG